MSLNKEQHNIITHLLKIEDDNNLFGCIEMLHFFIQNFPEAPGSSGNHQAYSGGYYKHISDIMDNCDFMYRNLSKKDKLDFLISDAILVLFLHDIEKPIKYSHNNEDSDNSIREHLIVKFNIKLTDEHKLALRYIHGEGDDYKKDKKVMSPLGAFCHCCDVISARIFFN